MDKFAKIIGYEDVKTELRMISDIICNSEKYQKLGVKEPNGLILYGNPGVGKTLMANCFIEAAGRKVFTCRKKKPDGEFVNEITEIFNKAKENAPSVIFLDDMDKYANEDENHKNAEEFVTLQSCIDDVKEKNVFVIATANCLRDIPDSLLRAGRFDKSIGVNNPEGEDAEKIIAFYLSQKNYVSDIDPKEIAGILDGESCAQLEAVINEAGIYSGYANKEKIDMQDILKACLRVIYSAPERNNIEEYDLRKIAYHEAGHAVIGEILDPGTVNLVSVQSNTGDIGGFTSQTKPKGYWYSKRLMENRVIALLGGKASTEIVYGDVDCGASDDLKRVFRLVNRFVDEYCVSGFDRSTRFRDFSNDLLSRKEMQVSVEIEHYYDSAKRILIENRDSLERVARSLMEEKTISGSRLRELMGGTQQNNV